MRCAISHRRIFWQCLRGNDLLWVIRNFCHSNFCHSNFCLIPFFSPPTLQHSFIFCGVALHCSAVFFLSASLLRAPDTFQSLFLEIVLHCEKSFTAYISWRFIVISDRLRKKKKIAAFQFVVPKVPKRLFLGVFFISGIKEDYGVKTVLWSKKDFGFTKLWWLSYIFHILPLDDPDPAKHCWKNVTNNVADAAWRECPSYCTYPSARRQFDRLPLTFSTSCRSEISKESVNKKKRDVVSMS